MTGVLHLRVPPWSIERETIFRATPVSSWWVMN